VVLESHIRYVTALAGLGEVSFADTAPGEGFGMRVVVEGAEAYLSYDRGVDPAEEIDRLAKRLAKVEVELERAVSKLAGESFIAKAPPDVVEKERAKQRELEDKRNKLDEQIKALKAQREGRS
jgi:valyl-tRNA synthetase